VNPDIPLKTSDEVLAIRRSCKIAAEILRSVSSHIKQGISTLELDKIAAALMEKSGVQAGVAKGFPGTICTSVNEVAAHGVPNNRRLRSGDLITIDVAVVAGGWYGDVAASFGVGEISEDKQSLLSSARRALTAALQAARSGSRMGDIGAAVLEVAEPQGCAVLPEFVGHGIGRQLHEEPVVPHMGRRGEGLPIVPGMVFSIEPALGLGAVRLDRDSDGWSLVTRDRSPVAQFEHTVAIFANRTEVLTDLECSGN
jgi:methionyl aminopeptidase